MKVNHNNKLLYSFITIIVILGIVLLVINIRKNNILNNNRLNVISQLQDFTNKEIQKYNVPGLAVYIDSPLLGESIQIGAGFTDLESKKPMVGDECFRIGSITKSFTATAILILQDKGLLNLENQVSDYLNIDNKYLKNITIKDVMNMNSGLRGYINDDPSEDGFIFNYLTKTPQKKLLPEELIQYGLNLTETQGTVTGFHYSNTNYIILGKII